MALDRRFSYENRRSKAAPGHRGGCFAGALPRRGKLAREPLQKQRQKKAIAFFFFPSKAPDRRQRRRLRRPLDGRGRPSSPRLRAHESMKAISRQRSSRLLRCRRYRPRFSPKRAKGSQRAPPFGFLRPQRAGRGLDGPRSSGPTIEGLAKQPRQSRGRHYIFF